MFCLKMESISANHHRHHSWSISIFWGGGEGLQWAFVISDRYVVEKTWSSNHLTAVHQKNSKANVVTQSLIKFLSSSLTVYAFTPSSV